jgi:hypothetical protein
MNGKTPVMTIRASNMMEHNTQGENAEKYSTKN